MEKKITIEPEHFFLIEELFVHNDLQDLKTRYNMNIDQLVKFLNEEHRVNINECFLYKFYNEIKPYIIHFEIFETEYSLSNLEFENPKVYIHLDYIGDNFILLCITTLPLNLDALI